MKINKSVFELIVNNKNDGLRFESFDVDGFTVRSTYKKDAVELVVSLGAIS